MRWVEHVACIRAVRNAKNISLRKPEQKRLLVVGSIILKLMLKRV
jgi:hypothetical protein